MAVNHKLCTPNVRVAFAILGIFVGVSVATVFALPRYHNYHVVCFGLLSGALAALTLWVHLRYRFGAYLQIISVSRKLIPVGILFQILSIAAFIVYIVMAIVEHQALVPEGDGFYLGAVWCFMSWKWAFQLWYWCRSYRNEILNTDGQPGSYLVNSGGHAAVM